MNTPDPNIIKLKNVRLSYASLFKARAAKGSTKLTFNATFLLDKKTHAAEIKLLQAGIDRVMKEEWTKAVKIKSALHDGAEIVEETEGYDATMMFLRSSSGTRPVVVRGDLSPVAEEDGIVYSGCYVNATVRLYAWAHETGGKGVSAGLRAVQFVKDGPAFGAGRVVAEDEFEPVAASDDVSNY